MTVAALYVDSGGIYPRLLGPEFCWDAARDANRYPGPWPVICHVPCGPWSRLSHMKLHDRQREEECAAYAVRHLYDYGGVLEQPAKSRLFERFGLTPVGERDRDAFSIEVNQVSWGHVARKPTWLHFVRVPYELVMSTLRTGGTPTHWCSGGRKRSSGSGGLVPPGIKVCSAQQRRRTPVDFARWLIELARSVRPATLHQGAAVMSAHIPPLLGGVQATGNRDESLTTEDYARLAQANADFDVAMAERLGELTPDQACALFDLAREGLAVQELRAHPQLSDILRALAEYRVDHAAFADPVTGPRSHSRVEAADMLLQLLRGSAP